MLSPHHLLDVNREVSLGSRDLRLDRQWGRLLLNEVNLGLDKSTPVLRHGMENLEKQIIRDLKSRINWDTLHFLLGCWLLELIQKVQVLGLVQVVLVGASSQSSHSEWCAAAVPSPHGKCCLQLPCQSHQASAGSGQLCWWWHPGNTKCELFVNLHTQLEITSKLPGKFWRSIEIKLKKLSRVWRSASESWGAPLSPWRKSSREAGEHRQLNTSCNRNNIH